MFEVLVDGAAAGDDVLKKGRQGSVPLAEREFVVR
jgi:hypothetical protein